MNKKLLISVVILIILIIAITTMGIFSNLNKNKAKVIETKTFSGIIFPENYDITYMTQEKRFTPSNDDVIKAEEILNKFLTEQNLSIIFQTFPV